MRHPSTGLGIEASGPLSSSNPIQNRQLDLVAAFCFLRFPDPNTFSRVYIAAPLDQSWGANNSDMINLDRLLSRYLSTGLQSGCGGRGH